MVAMELLMGTSDLAPLDHRAVPHTASYSGARCGPNAPRLLLDSNVLHTLERV
jgi:hypothetical protein